MDLATPSQHISATNSLLVKAKSAVSRAVEFAWQKAYPDNHWRGEVLGDVTLTSEQVFFYQSLGRSPIPDADGYRKSLLAAQQGDGSWTLAPKTPGNISASCEAYLALKILGMSPQAPEMVNAKKFILAFGGVAKVRIFTRIFFAQFGLFP
ncbi:hypothetical protein G7Z17_g2919 [Cylindrodendrum hubeiense]|uniref:Squalene cyclase N-terminal domain-containing protein n=1 Tax=Cylindrodendrum hubeiense TaxID=595255 RepID=A0A9P5HFN6_9HYPO|nr:hypothetical protein G7Z17_g2919 [Cylindrodendrum hubeiense]